MVKLKFVQHVEGPLFEQGEVGFSFANMKPVGKKFKTGSPLLMTYCVQCGKVASIKVKAFDMMKLL